MNKQVIQSTNQSVTIL